MSESKIESVQFIYCEKPSPMPPWDVMGALLNINQSVINSFIRFEIDFSVDLTLHI